MTVLLCTVVIHYFAATALAGEKEIKLVGNAVGETFFKNNFLNLRYSQMCEPS